jgi:glucose 1-dehydrogenase/3-oxoacyl-[acyl-carrier protein] reductase
VNNAGIDPRCSFFDVRAEMWDNVLATNLRGAFFCAQAAAREMRNAGGGRIINLSSVHGQATMANLAAYAASKGGIDAMTRQLALDLAPFRITVNAVAPGCVQVEKNTFDAVVRGREIPLGRVGRPLDVAHTIAFLASDAAEWLTGQVITVDGGSTGRLCLDHGRG